MTAECGRPGRLYPLTGTDQYALTAGPASPLFWQVCMTGRCPAHAAPGAELAARFTGQVVPCTWTGDDEAT